MSEENKGITEDQMTLACSKSIAARRWIKKHDEATYKLDMYKQKYPSPNLRDPKVLCRLTEDVIYYEKKAFKEIKKSLKNLGISISPVSE